MKSEIIDNAIELFAQKSYYGCTLDELAKSVDIKKASLYYYFPSKAAIYRECAQRCVGYFERVIEIENKKSSDTLSLGNLKEFILKTVFDTDINYLRLYLQFTQAPDEFKEELYDGVASLHKDLDVTFKRYYDANDIEISFESFRELVLGVMESGFIRTTFINYFDELSYRRKTLQLDVANMLDSLFELKEAAKGH
ncbi:TetR/AcrR family transcriptional regulator [Staphylococcus condimenti]|uniref:Biofilm operon icaADBC HTH-type negative transcriptional regulator IcaR n=1 Tax=Staphylococcus condimenti TaxID=70255 RepID=A0A143PDA8_9STAP|nr:MULTISPECIES: TetR/AcrR family transcriptional regulator [Staphylococcus]AMY05744.1 ica operon transcriptional regulator [Staphylococcus condimenti]APR61950.1 TetR family transcriptional regulator [Staphylococcus condimenti]MDK8645439.1 TetR/AcrR family transcriptional regulator [Staphylococcus condimenti]OFP03840.1 ica operon transcriptional regulator [Staphylococcus sp. HMSC065E08]PNZ59862.1 TetR/AcrR family transcriptional regulator [Staphylococcus condimenti]